MDTTNQNPYFQGYYAEGKSNPFEKDSPEWNQFEDGVRVRARHDAHGIEADPRATKVQTPTPPKTVSQPVPQARPSFRSEG